MTPDQHHDHAHATFTQIRNHIKEIEQLIWRFQLTTPTLHDIGKSKLKSMGEATKELSIQNWMTLAEVEKNRSIPHQLVAIDVDELDDALADDLHEMVRNGDHIEHEVWKAIDPEAAVSNQCWHILYLPEHSRGGIVLVGSGSNGESEWTDAHSAGEVLERLLSDTMMG